MGCKGVYIKRTCYPDAKPAIDLVFAYINFANFPAEKNKNSKSKLAVKYDSIYNFVDIEVIENKK